MGEQSIEHQAFSPELAIKKRIQYLEAQRDLGTEHGYTVGLLNDITAMDHKMTDAEQAESWDTALDTFNQLAEHDEELKTIYRSISPDYPRPPQPSEQEHAAILDNLRKEVDKRLRQDKKEK